MAGSGDALVVADAREDARLRDLPVVADHGIVAYVGAPLRDAAGTAVGSLCAMDTQPRTWAPADLEGLVDLAATASTELELRRLALELVEEARTDGLTGLLNRRGWEERAACEIAREERLRHGLVLAVLDLDRFKAVNDRLGHPGGDAILRRCATAWRSATRPFDVLARTGGEEFGVLLPGTDLECGAMVSSGCGACSPRRSPARPAWPPIGRARASTSSSPARTPRSTPPSAAAATARRSRPDATVAPTTSDARRRGPAEMRRRVMLLAKEGLSVPRS